MTVILLLRLSNAYVLGCVILLLWMQRLSNASNSLFFFLSYFLSHGPRQLMLIPSIFHISVNQMNRMYPASRNLLDVLHEGRIYEIGRFSRATKIDPEQLVGMFLSFYPF
jgi:hypothetical protein